MLLFDMLDPETTEYFQNILQAIVNIILSLNIVILVLWLIVLIRALSRSRKWNTINNTLYCREATLDAMNDKVQYYMSVFLLAIALMEMISSAVAMGLNTTFFVYLHDMFSNESNNKYHQAIPIYTEYNNTSTQYLYNNSLWSFFPKIWPVYSLNIPRVLMSSFSICVVLTFALVYTQMSYYAMVTRISLNYISSLKSVNLDNTQKLLMYGTVCMALVVSLLIVCPVFILKETITLFIFTIQFTLTLRNRKELLKAFKWKIQDTKLAFGEWNYLYKTYVKRNRYFKLISTVYSGMIACFLLAGALRLFRNIIEIFLSHYLLYQLIMDYPNQALQFIHGLTITVRLMHLAEEICLAIFFVLTLTLNVATLPALLSKLNYNCYCGCKLFKNRSNA